MQNSAFRPNSNRPVNRQILTTCFDGIPYGNYFDDISGRYSLDSIRLKFTYDTEFYDYDSRESKSTLDYLCFYIDQFRDNVDVTWTEQSFRAGKYAYVATCAFRNGSTASFLIGRYSFKDKKGIAPEVVADFNPNKVPFDDLKPILCELSLNVVCSPVVSRFDLAIDIPEIRSNVHLQYEGRATYQQICKTVLDKTEYLGKRNSHNRTKLYNKSLELGLDSNITRCEVTLEHFSSISNHIPDVYFTRVFQMDMDFSSLDFAVQACILHPDLVPVLKSSVSPNTWKKHKAVIDGFQNVKLSPVDVVGIDNFIASELKRYSEPQYWFSF